MIKTIAATALILALATSTTLAGGFSIDSGSGGGFGGFDDTFNDNDDVPWPTSLDDAGASSGNGGSGSIIGKGPKIGLDDPTPPNKKFDIEYVPGTKGTIASIDGAVIDGLSLACEVAGTPSEFPNDILIANTGLVEIPAHTRIVWQTEAPRIKGTAVLAKALKPGKATRANDVLRGGLPAGTACEVLTPRN